MTPVRVGSPRPSRDPQTHAPTDPSVLALGKTGQHRPKQLTPLAMGRRLRDPTTVTGDACWLCAGGVGSRDGSSLSPAIPPPLPTPASRTPGIPLSPLEPLACFFLMGGGRGGCSPGEGAVLRERVRKKRRETVFMKQKPRGLGGRPRLRLHRQPREGRTAASSEPPWTRAGLTTFLPRRTASEEANHGNPSSPRPQGAPCPSPARGADPPGSAWGALPPAHTLLARPRDGRLFTV